MRSLKPLFPAQNTMNEDDTDAFAERKRRKVAFENLLEDIEEAIISFIDCSDEPLLRTADIYYFLQFIRGRIGSVDECARAATGALTNATASQVSRGFVYHHLHSWFCMTFWPKVCRRTTANWMLPMLRVTMQPHDKVGYLTYKSCHLIVFSLADVILVLKMQIVSTSTPSTTS